jgi:hypothetical protein
VLEKEIRSLEGHATGCKVVQYIIFSNALQQVSMFAVCSCLALISSRHSSSIGAAFRAPMCHDRYHVHALHFKVDTHTRWSGAPVRLGSGSLDR